MLYRKIGNVIKKHFDSNSNKILIIDGARQVGKSFIIRYVGKMMFKNYVEINLLEDYLGDKLFENVKTIEDFYLQVSIVAKSNLGTKNDTLIFLDEIQAYPNLLTLLKFLKADNKFTYIASGSLLGVTLANTTSIPIGSIEIIHMYPLDFEEFLLANGVNKMAIDIFKKHFKERRSLDENIHNKLLDYFKKYLIVGGLPDAVNTYINEFNVVKIRKIQEDIHSYYSLDASKYDSQNKLKIRRVYDLIPSNLENKKKRVVIQDIENKKGKKASEYQDEFDYLISSGIALEVHAISNPKFPLIESSKKNLLKLYLNDVGLLTSILYKNNINAILNNDKSINLGSVYESVVASELKAHGHNLYYYDNKAKGEVDFLIDDYQNLCITPLEIKSGKDYSVHSALNNLLRNKDYNVKKGYVLSNENKVFEKNNIIYLPIYFIMFF